MNAEEIFLNAVEIIDQQRRSEYLEQVFRENSDLRAEVEALLQADERAGSFLKSPLVVPSDAFELEPLVDLYQPGEHIGPFQLQQVIGRGGMGVVYRAQQLAPVKRMVALKIIRPGISSRTVIQRFETERRALAIMDHPNIARVIDAGSTETGQPYFVMELINGVPITKYCDQARMTPRQRLELMIPVCEAIQHAHQKGIIHRDIKPSNVLVTEYDARPVPKIIDFGVAKAVGNQLNDLSLHTDFGSVVGTLEYMSPEQAGLEQQDIDTRSDIYSLGVLIYELLTGSTPISREHFNVAAMAEMLRIIREEDAQRPSARISSTDNSPTVAANRNTEPARLSGLLRGELDWIAMKALEKDRSRRYQSVHDLANDIQHFLHDETVSAGPPTFRYRFVKFVRRNRVAATFGSLLILAVLGGTVGTSVGMIQANRALRNEIAERQQAEQVSSLLESIFSDLDTYSFETDFKSSLRRRLQAIVSQIMTDSTLRPLSKARLQDAIGHTLLGIDEAGLAEEVLRDSFGIREKQLGPKHPDTLYSQNALGFSLFKQKKSAEALPVFQAAWNGRSKVLGPYDGETLSSQMNIASCLLQMNRRSEAKEEFQKIQQIVDQGHVLHDTDQEILLTWLSTEQIHQGNQDEAMKTLDNIYHIRAQHYGDDHPATLDALENLAMMHQMMNDWQGALPLWEKLVICRTNRMGNAHAETTTAKIELAVSYYQLKMADEAIPLYRELLNLKRRENPPNTGLIGKMLGRLGSLQLEKKQFEEAEATLEEASSIFEKEHPNLMLTIQIQSLLGAALAGEKKFEQAEPLLLNSYERMMASTEQLKATDRIKITGAAMDRIIQLYEAWEKPEQANLWANKKAALASQ